MIRTLAVTVVAIGFGMSSAVLNAHHSYAAFDREHPVSIEGDITQVVFGRSAQTGWKRYLYLSAIHRFLRDAPPVDVHIVTQEMK